MVRRPRMFIEKSGLVRWWEWHRFFFWVSCFNLNCICYHAFLVWPACYLWGQPG